ncbi:rod shape-determining protein MreC [Candidatus Uhrbacteria bacterium]|nr:rod shape-determining protein MreC [Candidatus Uhrbacteria bacterium]
MRRFLVRVALAVVVLGAVALTSRVFAPTRTVWVPSAMQAPIARVSIRVRVWSDAVWALVRSPQRLAERERERGELDAAIVARDRELQELRQALALARVDLASRDWGSPMVARVLAGNFSSGSAIIVVDRGAADRVTVGDPVVVRGALVGMISEVNVRRSRVRLLGDAWSRFDIAASTASGIIGILESDPGGGVALTHIPGDAEFTTGTAIVTGPVVLSVPVGIPIGRIGDIRVDADGFFRRASIDLTVNPAHEGLVTILRQTKE